jgi:hypothetical protein
LTQAPRFQRRRATLDAVGDLPDLLPAVAPRIYRIQFELVEASKILAGGGEVGVPVRRRFTVGTTNYSR